MKNKLKDKELEVLAFSILIAAVAFVLEAMAYVNLVL